MVFEVVDRRVQRFNEIETLHLKATLFYCGDHCLMSLMVVGISDTEVKQFGLIM